jgi:7-cyano-7-deazaguanine synthase in queuosine biosynthesis
MTIYLEIDGDHRRHDGLALVTIVSPQFEGVELDLSFKELHQLLGAPNPLALDLLLVAGTCYVIDKVTPRSLTTDAWTRDLSVKFPVSDPRHWSKVSSQLDSALSFLTGDVWKTSFQATSCDLFAAPKHRSRRLASDPNEPKSFHAVTLLSGGLDSLIGTIDFLERHPDCNTILVGHYDYPGPGSQQSALYSVLRTKYPRRTKLVQVRVSQKPMKNAETSLRSRSIVFLGLGLYVASQINGSVPLLAPENGLISLNLPLTPSRIGSCSTRTMHPFYLNTFRSIVRDLGFKNEIVNPLELKTKGECVTGCGNLSLLGALTSKTVSCSHSTRRQLWKRRNAANCGYCVPCLFRRAALHTAKLDNGMEYGIDVCADELTVSSNFTSGDDIRALTSWLRQFNTNNEIQTDNEIRRAITTVANVEPLEDYVALVNRGLSQIRAWIREKGSDSLREAAGIHETDHA